jgi:UbiD family decarboxylase
MAAIQDLRGFLEVLEKNGQLRHITEEVQLEPDIGAAGRAISQRNRSPGFLSNRPIE